MEEIPEIYYGLEEKFLVAVDKYECGDYAESKLRLERILEEHPDYAPAHFYLGAILLYSFRHFRAAGYHFELCIKFAPEYPYAHHALVDVLNTLNDTKQLLYAASVAIKVPGVCSACVWNAIGDNYERNQVFKTAKYYYRKAWFDATGDCCIDDYKSSMDRIDQKIKARQEFT